jgi:D-psicose/D-tagatose/L-ribulose 3-epimerase
MKIGFSMLLWTTHVDRSHWPILQALKDAGYDGAEIPVTSLTLAECTELAGFMADIGLNATASGGIPDQARNPISADPKEAQAGIDHLRTLVDRAEALGAKALIGPFYQPLGQFSGQGISAAERERLVDALQQMAIHAYGKMILAVEPLNRFECYALNTMEQAKRLVWSVDWYHHGYLFDTFHANIEEADPLRAIRESAGTIYYVHVSENDRGVPGRGHIDFAGTFAALKSIGYDGWLTVEAFGQALPDLAAATRIWRPLFDTETQVYEDAITLIRQGWANAGK